MIHVIRQAIAQAIARLQHQKEIAVITLDVVETIVQNSRQQVGDIVVALLKKIAINLLATITARVELGTIMENRNVGLVDGIAVIPRNLAPCKKAIAVWEVVTQKRVV